ncbi:MAG: hypothetical protein GY768_18720 [Planctomycetaceae bacterium]|nr:hypothetical protein [Planctomycetaceae bacterium]
MRIHSSADSEVRHKSWVKISHWIVATSFLTLAVSGIVILMCHPRLYWGESGNELTPALFELPISRNHQHGGWKGSESFFGGQTPPISSSRTYDIYNQNSWARSLHFLSAWFLVIAGVIYFLTGIFTGYFWQFLVPRQGEFTPSLFLQDLKGHLQLKIPPATGGPQYGLLQKLAYCVVIFVAFPLMVLTGLAMSPAITATFPFLSDMFGGFQSARTIHFFDSIFLFMFLLVHVVMISRSGFKRQLLAMTFGKKTSK